VSVIAPKPSFAQIESLTIGNYQLVSKQRVGRTTYDYIFRADVTNTGTEDAVNVSADLTSLASTMTVIEGHLAFVDIPAGSTATSTDTCTIRIDRRYPFNETYLSCIFDATFVGSGTDNDGDGYISVPSGGDDCDDTNPNINPGASEVCDGVDNDCNGQIDEGVKTTYYADTDSDGFGDPANTTLDCSPPSGYVDNSADCNDADSNEFPGQIWYKDADNDSYSDGTTDSTSCVRPVEYKAAVELTAVTGDCNDGDAAINPAATEVCDYIDNNCDGQFDEGVKTTYYADTDSDGYGDTTNTVQDCTTPAGYVADNTDCDDTDGLIHPGTSEICDGKDNNCDGQIDEGVKTTYYADTDSDGYGDPNNIIQSCILPVGYTTDSTDCNDADPNTFPGASEVCDGVDNNCDSQIDESVTTTYYADTDGDGFGDPAVTIDACRQPSGYVADNTDFNDLNANAYPGATDIPGNGIDEDGDGSDSPLVTISSPVTLSTVGSSPVTVTGTISNPAAIVTVNGVNVSVTNNTYSVSGIIIEEGANTITAMVIDSNNNVNTDNITVYLDSTPPNVNISSPADGYVATSSPVTVSGSINDIVIGTVNANNATVQVNGVTATVSNNTFMADAVPLVSGVNVITATAADQTGNTASNSINITLDLSANKKVEMVSGNSQTGIINSSLAGPLIVSLTNTDGSPAVGKTVIFKVTRNNGQLTGNSGAAVAIARVTDTNGHANALFTLGSTSGVGNNEVEVTSIGFKGKVIFTASATQSAPVKINIGSGNDQRGAVYTSLPLPLVAVVTDQGHNIVSGVPVAFTVAGGGGKVNGSDTIVVDTDSDGRASATFTLGSQEGINNNTVVADFPGNTAAPAVFRANGLSVGDPGDTKISGLVLDNSNIPIPGVTIRVQGTTRAGVADDQGQFLINNVPVGPLHLIVDGSTATYSGVYPVISYDMVTVAGQNNTIGMPIYLLPLNTTNTQWVGASNDVLYTLQNIPGFSLNIKANSVTFPDGSHEGFYLCYTGECGQGAYDTS